MKYRLILCIISLMVLLSSCMFTQETLDNMISPQKLDKTQQQIYQAFITDVGANSDIELIYPNKGEYLSSFIIQNMDNTQGEEAIVFYKNNSIISKTNSDTICVNLLDTDEYGNWNSVWITHETEVVDIDKFYILNSNGEKLLIIGYNLSRDDNLKRISVIKYTDKSLQRIYSLEATDFEIIDINNNGVEELVTISDKDKRVIDVYEYNSDGLSKITTKQTDYTEYASLSITKGMLNQDKNALYFDEKKLNDDIYTDILYFQNNQIITLNDINSDLKIQTKRNSNAFIYDIDDDKEYEIPTQIDIVGSDYLEEKTFVKWLNYNYDSKQMEEKQVSYVDMKLGYIFNIPSNWLSNITYTKDELNNEVTFYVYNSANKKDNSKKLLKIKTFVPDINTTNVGMEQYTMMDYGENLKYGYIIYTTNTEYDITKQDVEKLFNKI